MEVSKEEVKKVAKKIFPEEGIRSACLKAFTSSIEEADEYGPEKWGVYFQKDRIRLLLGNLIVCTAHEKALWMALDKEGLKASDDKRRLLETSGGWDWDSGDYPEYSSVPSVNGYYRPHRSSADVRSLVEDLHFAFLRKAAAKYEKLNRRSQAKHDSRVLDFLEQELGLLLPRPEFGKNQPSDPHSDLEEKRGSYESLPETEREAVVQSRLGQGIFRRRLMVYWSEACAVTGCKKKSLLRASHIKPWRDSNNEERLDRYNGLLLVPNLDAAFDAGLITFSNDGSLLISDALSKEDRDILGFHDGMEITKLQEGHLKYLSYHRNHVFLQG